MSSNKYSVEVASSGRANCKDIKCKKKIEKGSTRIAILAPSYYHEGSLQTNWYHYDCFFNHMTRARKAKVESIDELQGIDKLSEQQQNEVKEEFNNYYDFKFGGGKKTKKKGKRKKKEEVEDEEDVEDEDVDIEKEEIEEEKPKKKRKSTPKKKTPKKTPKKNQTKRKKKEEEDEREEEEESSEKKRSKINVNDELDEKNEKVDVEGEEMDEDMKNTKLELEGELYLEKKKNEEVKLNQNEGEIIEKKEEVLEDKKENVANIDNDVEKDSDQVKEGVILDSNVRDEDRSRNNEEIVSENMNIPVPNQEENFQQSNSERIGILDNFGVNEQSDALENLDVNFLDSNFEKGGSSENKDTTGEGILGSDQKETKIL